MALSKLDPAKLTGAQKAAIFLVSMGAEYTESFFRHLDDKKVITVGKEINRLPTIIPSSVRDAVMSEFVSNFENEADLMVSGKAFLKEAVGNALEPDKAREVIRLFDDEATEAPFTDLEYMPSQNLVSIFEKEHPQTIALILSHLPEEKAAEILCLLPEELQAGVAVRIVEISDVQDDVVRDLDEILKRELEGIGTTTTKFDGIEKLANILNEADRGTEEGILAHIEKEDGDMADMIRQKMFLFEDLISVDAQSFREILQNVSNDVMAKALKTATEELREKVFSSMSERASEMLKEDLEVLGPVRLKEVEESQQSIIRVAKNLEAEGKIALAGKGKEDAYV